MTLPVQPFRGEVWDADLAVAGPQPIVVLTANPLLPRLSSATGVLVTETAGPRATHVPLGADAGLTGHEESYAVATELHNVPLRSLLRQRGRLSRSELLALDRRCEWLTA